MKVAATLLGLIMAGFSPAAGVEGPNEDPPPLLRDDELRLVDFAARAINGLEAQIWPLWPEAPDRLLYISERGEFLFAAEAPPESAGFRISGQTAGRNSIFHRPAQMPAGLEATFNLYDSVPTTVIGAPQATGRDPAGWVAVVAHEHFHQLQYSRPGYYERVKALDLAGDDTTGMWMLNYPFPYDDNRVAGLFGGMAAALAKAWRAHAQGRTKEERGRALASFLGAKGQLRDSLGEADYRYLSFQLWQEGVARYTEHQAALKLADASPLAIGGAEPAAFGKYASDLLLNSLLALDSDDLLTSQRRVAFYAVGHIEALLLDFVAEGWKQDYFDGRLATDGLFPAAF